MQIEPVKNKRLAQMICTSLYVILQVSAAQLAEHVLSAYRHLGTLIISTVSKDGKISTIKYYTRI